MQRSTVVCNNTQEYHCLPTDFLNKFVEHCLKVESINPGYCAIYNTYLGTVHTDVNSFCDKITDFRDCPKDFYNSNKIYLYPSCLKINPVKLCYLADPNCPNITSNDHTYSTDTMDLMDSTTNPGTGGTNDARKLFPLIKTCPTFFYIVILLTINFLWIHPFG